MTRSSKQLLGLLAFVFLFIFIFSLINPFDTPLEVELREPQIDYFTQGEASSAVDVLWVIDNSLSMESSQDNLALNFATFAKQLVNESSDEIIDYQMAVVTTDFTEEGAFVNNRVLTSQEAKQDERAFVNDFQDLVRVGTMGSPLETPLMCMILSTRNPENQRFFRKDAILVVNIVSDESDMSANFTENLLRNIDGWVNADPNNPLFQQLVGESPDRMLGSLGIPEDLGDLSVLGYVKMIKAFKPGKRVMINSIVSMENDGLYSTKGEEQMMASNMTNGLIADIGSDFARTLSNWGENISSLASSFALSRTPDTEERIQVFVDGYFIEKEYWDYNPRQQSIEFTEGYLPEPGEEIEVHYEIFNEYDEYES